MMLQKKYFSCEDKYLFCKSNNLNRIAKTSAKPIKLNADALAKPRIYMMLQKKYFSCEDKYLFCKSNNLNRIAKTSAKPI